MNHAIVTLQGQLEMLKRALTDYEHKVRNRRTELDAVTLDVSICQHRIDEVEKAIELLREYKKHSDAI